MVQLCQSQTSRNYSQNINLQSGPEEPLVLIPTPGESQILGFCTDPGNATSLGAARPSQHPAALNVHIYNSNFVLNSPAENLCYETVDSIPKISYPLNMLSRFLTLQNLHYTLRFCGSKLSFYSLLFYFSVPCEYEFLRGVVILHTSKAQANNLCADSFSAIGNNTYHFYNTIKMPAIRTVSFNKCYRWQDQRTNIQIGVT